MKQHTIVIEYGCKVLKSKELFVKAMQCLPADAEVTSANFGLTGGHIMFTSALLGDASVYNFCLSEEVSLRCQASKY